MKVKKPRRYFFDPPKTESIKNLQPGIKNHFPTLRQLARCTTPFCSITSGSSRYFYHFFATCWTIITKKKLQKANKGTQSKRISLHTTRLYAWYWLKMTGTPRTRVLFLDKKVLLYLSYRSATTKVDAKLGVSLGHLSIGTVGFQERLQEGFEKKS